MSTEYLNVYRLHYEVLNFILTSKVIDLLDECSAADGDPSTSNNKSKYYCHDMMYFSFRT